MGVGNLSKRYNLVHSERSEIINLKMNYFKDINHQQQKLFSIFLSSINPDVHVNKQKHFIKGVPPEVKIFKKWRLFL